MTYTQRVLICTFVALASGFGGAFVGGKLSVTTRTSQCETLPWGLSAVCQAGSTPAALLQGSTTGLWTGSILGAFIAGLATRNKNREDQS